MKCVICGNENLNIVTKNIMGEYTTWDCNKCGAHGTIKKGKIHPLLVDTKQLES